MKNSNVRLMIAFAGLSAVALWSGCSSMAAKASSNPPATPPVYHDLASYYQSLPQATDPPLDELRTAMLAIYPLTCIDRLQSGGGRGGGGAAPEEETAPAAGAGAAGGAQVAPAATPAAAPPAPGANAYLWIPPGQGALMQGYANQRAFFGCNDWHSAVESTWTMVVALKRYPDLTLSKLLRERLSDHLAKRNLDGEIAYFQGARTFERPYGQAWAMRLYVQLSNWNDPDGKKWAANLQPLVQQFAAGMPTFLKDMPDAVRQGTTGNTANALHLLYGYADAAHDDALRSSIDTTARRLFLDDQDCPTAYESDSTAVLSPCLSEAALMSDILDRQAYAAWLDKFLPAANSKAFQYVATPLDVSVMQKTKTLPAKTNMVGLQFSRAEDFVEIARALPPADARVPVYRRLAALEATAGYKALGVAGDLGPQWIPAIAMMYQMNVAGTTTPDTKMAGAVAIPVSGQ